MIEKQVDVAIVGGGIAGLSTAYYWQKWAEEAGIEANYLLLEGSDRWGGKILTERADDDFVIEGGPDSFITQKPWAYQLAQALGLDEEFLPTSKVKKSVFVLNKGRPTPMPDGVMLIVPTEIKPFLLSPLISLWGKLRMGLDWFVKPKMGNEDETLAEFIQRRLGQEALDKIAEPLMSGIYNAAAEKQSIMATFPRFRAIEQKHGSLIKGMLAAKKHRPRPSGNGQKRPASVFMSLRGGMVTLVDAIRERLTGDCRLGTQVATIERSATGGYLLTLDDGSVLAAQQVVLAVPAYIAAQLIGDMAPDAAEELNGIRYVSTGTISLAFSEAEVGQPLTSYGLVIPRTERRSINAITCSSIKFDHRAPAGSLLLRVFFGGSRHPEMMEHDDATLTAIVRRELQELLGITAEPQLTRIYRWWQGNPQYDVGHLDRVAGIEAALPAGLHVTGSPYRGIGLPDCIHQGQMTVAKLAESVHEQKALVA